MICITDTTLKQFEIYQCYSQSSALRKGSTTQDSTLQTNIADPTESNLELSLRNAPKDAYCDKTEQTHKNPPKHKTTNQPTKHQKTSFIQKET